jgi:hypothetical protein
VNRSFAGQFGYWFNGYFTAAAHSAF